MVLSGENQSETEVCRTQALMALSLLTNLRLRIFEWFLRANSLIYLQLRTLLLPQCFLEPVPNISPKMGTPPSH